MLRSSFGIIGSNVPALIRALVACGWFGIQTLFGGIAVHLMLAAMFDGWAQLGGVGEVIGFFIFWVANVWVVLRGSESIKWLEVVAAPLLMLVGVGLLVWAWPQASVTRIAGAAAATGRRTHRSSATSSRASPRWWASGRRCRSTFRTSAASPNRSERRSSGRSSACR